MRLCATLHMVIFIHIAKQVIQTCLCYRIFRTYYCYNINSFITKHLLHLYCDDECDNMIIGADILYT